MVPMRILCKVVSAADPPSGANGGGKRLAHSISSLKASCPSATACAQARSRRRKVQRRKHHVPQHSRLLSPLQRKASSSSNRLAAAAYQRRSVPPAESPGPKPRPCMAGVAEWPRKRSVARLAKLLLDPQGKQLHPAACGAARGRLLGLPSPVWRSRHARVATSARVPARRSLKGRPEMPQPPRGGSAIPMGECVRRPGDRAATPQHTASRLRWACASLRAGQPGSGTGCEPP